MALTELQIRECLSEMVSEDQAEVNAFPLLRTQWHGLFRGMENWFEANRAAAKTAMETEAGITISNALAKKIGRIYLRKKWGTE